MRVDLFDFALPPELIAQRPAEPRESARLLAIGAGGVGGAALADRRIADLPDLLRPGDLLVLNDTRVIPTRFFARRGEAAVEITLVEPQGDDAWWAFAKPGKRLRPGDRVALAPELWASVRGKREDGLVDLRFDLAGPALLAAIRAQGAMPLPPYIRRERGGDPRDLDDYQTVFARSEGSVAAPTASLHLTRGLLARLAAQGVQTAFVTLHVGLGTFLPVKVDDTADHRMHAEWFEVPEATAAAWARTRVQGGRIVAVGTTALRTLESAMGPERLLPGSGRTELFVTPGHALHGADLLLTNFHLPRSTLFMLVCAFGGMDRLRAAYAHAIATGYRFFSYGDACLIERS
jgi:S-adenosylmethionine:tRNA ribosyltransferase-isomerase